MKDYHFYKTVSKQVLCNYLDRAMTISRGGFVADQAVKNFILNTGAKFICRAATCWAPKLTEQCLANELHTCMMNKTRL